MTVLQRIDLADRISLTPAAALRIDGFPQDTIVRRALESLAEAAGVAPAWRVRIQKKIPVAGGLGGGSSDAATALRLANETLDRPLAVEALAALAAQVGADVPFFLGPGPQLGLGDGSTLEPLDLPQDYWVVVLLPGGATKGSTASVYSEFDERGGEDGFEQRRDELLAALAAVGRPRDLAALPSNDLVASPLAGELLAAGAFRADVSGAGPCLYGLFHHEATARTAARGLRRHGVTWMSVPTWYG